MTRSSTASAVSTAPPGATPDASLHPMLQQALANIDTQLDAELARYRRQRSATGRTANRRTAPQPLDLPPTTVPSPTAPAVHRPDTLEPPVQPAASLSIPPISSTPTPANQAVDSAIATVAASGEPLEMTAPAAATADDDLAETDESIEDYLESSEELLRSLAEEEAKVQAERGFMRSLLTPLGLGSLLLMLLSSAMFGYIVMNPGSLSRWLTTRMTPPEPSSTTPSVANSPMAEGAPQPNLAAREFKDLGLDTLGTLKPSSSVAFPKPMQSAAPRSTPRDRPRATNPAIPVIEPPMRESEPPALTPIAPAAPIQPAPLEPAAPEPEAIAPAPAAPPEPEPTASVEAQPPDAPQAQPPAHPYKVVTPYTGDASLDTVQKVVPDAFVNGNGEAQAGAFTSAAEAEARAAELRQQGISAEVQKR